jgi:hypothetical protein
VQHHRKRKKLTLERFVIFVSVVVSITEYSSCPSCASYLVVVFCRVMRIRPAPQIVAAHNAVFVLLTFVVGIGDR